MVASELFSSLAAPVFAAMLFIFFLKRRSREINGGEANNNATANNGTAGGDSGTHTSTEVPEVATSSGANKDAAANDGTAGGDSGTRTSTEVPEVATSSGANKDAAANDGTAGGDSGTHTSTEVPEMPTSSGYDYEVFLSFKGSDTRSGFTDFLYTSLNDAGIRTFKDDESLRKGEEFAPELLQAINQSKILIPIFSKDYASSVWCLKELVEMVKCEKTGRQKIMPIFYDVAPSEVRHQTEDYGKALRVHEEKGRYDEEIMRQWKAALSAVPAINGWDLHSKKENRREGEFAKTVTREVLSELNQANLVVSDRLVSVDNHVDAIMEKIGAGTSETRIIGIHGMGGIGKTTIAKIIYNQLSKGFNNCCFLSNIRETSETKGIECLQNRLIFDILKIQVTNIRDSAEGTGTIRDRLSNKKVIILLDDVDHREHMAALVGNRDWFGKGSKLIITTRNKEVLKVPQVDDCYEVKFMDDRRSLQLFSKHAFIRDDPPDEYIDRSKKAIKLAGGLPLALEVIGSLLFGENKTIWDAKFEKLASIPHADVQSKLKISYDALSDEEKCIFLDIACLFNEYDRDILVHFWNASKLFPIEAMNVLQNLSLIKIIKHNKVWMHDQLRDLGRRIVRQESEKKIETQRRVWDPKEGLDLLRKHKGNKEVEALRLNLDNQRQYCFTYEGFESLSKLRFLEVGGSMENFRAEESLIWHESPSNVPPANENSYLLPQLRCLSWQRIPPTFNITNFSMEEVVILDLSRSDITHDWKGWSHMAVMKNLKVMDLSHCLCLRRLPDKLCKDLASLEYLSLNNCKGLDELPHTIGNLKSLIELDISEMKIEKLPDSIGNLKNLKVVRMILTAIKKIPDALWTIEKLEEITVRALHDFDVKIGDGISRNRSLRILKLLNVRINVVPPRLLPESLIILELSTLHMDTFPDLSNLTNLKELRLRFKPRDDGGESDGPVEEYPMPPWIRNLSKLGTLVLRSDYVTHLPTDISSLLPRLRLLELVCRNLRCLPSLPSSLSSLYLGGCKSLGSLGDLSNLKNLSFLFIKDSVISVIGGLDGSENLDLQLSELQQVWMLPDLSNINQLRSLLVCNCGNLVEIQGELPQFLEDLVIHDCGSLQKLPDLSSLKALRRVSIKLCGKLNVEAISSLCSEKSIQYYGDETNYKYESGSEGEDAESESEAEGEDDESEVEDHEVESEAKGEDDESEV